MAKKIIITLDNTVTLNRYYTRKKFMQSLRLYFVVNDFHKNKKCIT